MVVDDSHLRRRRECGRHRRRKTRDRRREAARHECPEGVEPFERYVGQPEAEEDSVVAAVWLPVEDVGAHEAHPVAVDPSRGDREHLWRRIHGGDVVGVTEKLPGPQALAAGELQGGSYRSERI